MPLDRSLICAYGFPESGPPTTLDSAQVDSWNAQAGWVWIHLDRTSDEVEPWLHDAADLDDLAIEALLQEETRPRCEIIGDGLLVLLRGVNLNAGAEPEDMVSIRLWVDPRRVISLRHRKLMAVQDVRDAIARGEAPATPGALLIEIAAFLIDRMGTVLDDLNDAVDQVEEDVLDAPSAELRSKLSQLRRQAISLRRFLAPQREVFTRLSTVRTGIFTETDHGQLREITDRLTRYIEELDSARDRAAVTQEELGGRISDQMNRNMYVLSIVAGIFLPLGLLTGLLGINVGGLPGTQSKWAFAIVCVILVALAGLVVWMFKKMRLL
ncbi:MAG: zinc transporter ZntB [Phycisphaerales bacterium]